MDSEADDAASVSTEGSNGSSSSSIDLSSDTFRDLVFLLSSSDGADESSTKRIAAASDEATSRIVSDEDEGDDAKECRTELGSGGLGLEAASKCSSPIAYHNLATLLQTAIHQTTDPSNSNLAHLCVALSVTLERSGSTDSFVAESASHHQQLCLADAFMEVARRPVSSNGGTYAALAVALSLYAENDDSSPPMEEMRTLFLDAALKNQPFATPSQLSLLPALFERGGVDQTFFDGKLAPILGLKLRAHPDTVLPAAEVVFSMLVGAAGVDVASQLNKGAELLPSVVKHLKSAKAELRGCASRTLVHLAQLGGGNGSKMVTEAISAALKAKGASASALTTPGMRRGAYAALTGIAEYYRALPPSSDAEVESTVKLADDVLTGLAPSLSKEKGGGNGDARERGMDALLAWMSLRKRGSGGGLSAKAANKKGGYGAALAYLVEPVGSGKYTLKESAEMRFRFGSLLLLPTTDGSNGFVESVVTDMLDSYPNAVKGLEAAIEAANKKHTAGGGGIGGAQQIDGTIATYVFAIREQSFPASALKAITAGSLKSGPGAKETSFFFSDVVLEAVRTDPLVHRAVHRTLALQCKAASKKEGSADKPLVRLVAAPAPVGGAAPSLPCVSYAARALGACLVDPPDGGDDPATAPAVHLSIRAILDYSSPSARVGDALLLATFDRVNERSLAAASETSAGEETAAALVGYDAASVRTAVLGMLLPRATDAGAVARGMVLGHAGTPTATAEEAAVAEEDEDGDDEDDENEEDEEEEEEGEGEESERDALMNQTVAALKETVLPLAGSDGLAAFVALCASSSRFDLEKKEESASNAEVSQDKGGKTKKEDTKSEGSDEKNDATSVVSSAIHGAALSLIATLGGIGGQYDPDDDEDAEDEDADDRKSYAFAHDLCVTQMPPRLVAHLTNAKRAVEALTEEDMALVRSPKGVVFRSGGTGDSNGDGGAAKPAAAAKKVEKKKRVAGKKGRGGFNLEDEEWERQVKEDLERKKSKAAGGSAAENGAGLKTLSPEDVKLLAVQTARRDEISSIVTHTLPRALAAVRALCESDIEVGNAALPLLAPVVVGAVVSSAPALVEFKFREVHQNCFDTLVVLASCVYEIDEAHATDVAEAVAVSFGRKDPEWKLTPAEQKKRMKETLAKADDQSTTLVVVAALPSPCPPAIAVVLTEMDDYGEPLSGPSFAFLLPVLRAVLSGPRNVPGCESALTLLHRHTPLLAGDDMDAVVKPLRKDMAVAVLELLAHDRSKTFVDPTPYEALIECYVTDEDGAALTNAEIAPLLGEKGALGGENARVGAMEALAAICQSRPKVAKTNPLVENRIWLNSFEKKGGRVRFAARRTWAIVNGHDGDFEEGTDFDAMDLDAPSKMYAVPLLPLLNHEDKSIAAAAASSYSFAMGMHPDSTERNVLKLCNSYISAFPAPEGGGEEPAKTSPFPTAPPAKKSPFPAAPVRRAPAKKSIIDTGLKKKTKKTSAVTGSMARITGGVAPKRVAATKKLIAKTERVERTLDTGSLMDQFKPDSTSKKVKAEDDTESKVAVRLGVLAAVSALTDTKASVDVDLPVLKILTGFLTAFGLGDVNESVRTAARNAVRDVVACYGASDEAIAFFLPMFEGIIGTGLVPDIEACLGSLPPDKVPCNVASQDYRKEGIVVALGSVALHLKDEESADKIDGIIDMLLGALKTPSEEVQLSVSLCLSKLMKKGRTQKRIDVLLSDLIDECVAGASLASRRGSAYGISAVVKGSGIASLKKYEVVKRLEEACSSGTPSAKEGALFAIELLSGRLGILFEPYVIVLLPALLKAFSDPNDYVRIAADKTVGLIMSKLSGHGVKLVMPAVLEAFDEPEWRTKQASIHMLGSMSHCAPKQLANCLPKIVPKLTEAFSDTHPKVKSSAEHALEELTKVIKNPEISSISAILLKALTDPATGTVKALEALIETEFLHAIDAPSLALIVPVLHRGLRDRAATTKRYGALISGNICTMINDARDFVPYLPTLLPDLKSTLLDPIPDVRSISAKALGSLTRGLGEATFPDLRPWLVESLRSESGSSVERSGAAQGLTEVLVAGGAMLTESVMRNEILPLKSHPKAGTREGVLWVLTFLPSALGQAFSSLIDDSLPALLSGLADDSETVRDVALRAGRVLVKSHGKAHKDKILPSLESGLHNEDYRIRVASLTLLGDLLSMLGGTKVVKGNADTQDDIRQAERAQAQIALVLGPVTRKRVLSSLYIARCDTAAMVRVNAIQVWKTVVSVTPRTLREILSELIDQIVTALASGDIDRTEVAGRCLGDIVQKLGDQVLPSIIPVLRDALYRGDENTRHGCCLGLSEVISSSSKETIVKFLDILVKAVQDALCDDFEEVRNMAASCFQSLYNVVGPRTFDEVVPALLVAMESSDELTKNRALNGLTVIMSLRQELLPYIIPKLLKAPLTISHLDALGSISTATSDTIFAHFNTIIPTLLMEVASFSDVDVELEEDGEQKEREEATRRCIRAVCHNVDENCVNVLVGEIASKCAHDRESVRKEACWFHQVIIEERKDSADFYEQIPIILRDLLQRLNDSSSLVLKATNKALTALTKNVPAEELVNHIQFIRNLVASMVSEARYRKGGVGDGQFFLPGFNMPKGLEPLLPIYQRGILYGDSTVREHSAAGLGELIAITSNKFLAGPFLIKLTGPLLRIVGDRNPSAVKIAIVQTLGLILTKGGPVLRAFVPQFQTTFVKALSDPSRQVRVEAIKALALLMPLSTRVDPLIKELVSSSLGKGANLSVETAGLVTIQTATLEALAVVLKHGGKKVKLPESIPSALDTGKLLVLNEDDGVRESAAKVIGYACELSGADVTNDVIQELVLDNAVSVSSNSSEMKHGIACICRRVFATSIGVQIDRNVFDNVSSIIQTLMKDEKVSVREAACEAIGAVLGSSNDTHSTIASLEKSFVRHMDSKENMEVQQAVARGLCIAARMKPGLFRTEEGLLLTNSALKLAMSGAQRVQFSYNDFLWVALDVSEGDAGLEEYLNLAHFENAKVMKQLHSKVLVRIKGVDES